MKFTDTDAQESNQVAEFIKFCDTADNATLEKISDEIYLYQPFVLSLFLGFKDEVDIFQLDEILRIFLIIWLFFRDRENVKKKKITEKIFEARQRKNLQFLQYMQDLPIKQDRDQALNYNLGALKSKALFKFKEGPTLKKLETARSALMLIGIKSLIECFEHISRPKKHRPSRR